VKIPIEQFLDMLGLCNTVLALYNSLPPVRQIMCQGFVSLEDYIQLIEYFPEIGSKEMFNIFEGH
jgi:hypothetical protein